MGKSKKQRDKDQREKPKWRSLLDGLSSDGKPIIKRNPDEEILNPEVAEILLLEGPKTNKPDKVETKPDPAVEVEVVVIVNASGEAKVEAPAKTEEALEMEKVEAKPKRIRTPKAKPIVEAAAPKILVDGYTPPAPLPEFKFITSADIERRMNLEVDREVRKRARAAAAPAAPAASTTTSEVEPPTDRRATARTSGWRERLSGALFWMGA